MVLRWHFEQKLKKAEVDVGYTIPVIAGVLLLVGSFFFGFAFSDLPNLNWVLIASAATMIGGFALDIHNQAQSGKALKAASDTILDVIKELQKAEDKILGTRGELHTSWSNSIYDRVAALEREVDQLKKGLKNAQHF